MPSVSSRRSLRVEIYLFISLLAFSFGPWLGALQAAPDPAEEQAETEFKALKDRFDDANSRKDKLFQDVLEFRRTYPGSAAAVKAAGLLRQLPSPLDRLTASAIPPLEKFDWQPKELVAVLAEHRGRHGNSVNCVAY